MGWFNNIQTSTERIGHKIEDKIQNKEAEVTEFINSSFIDTIVQYSRKKNNTSYWRELLANSAEKSIITLIYYKNDLKLWTDAKVITDSKFVKLNDGNNFKKLDNGWYFIIQRTINDTKVLCLIPIKKEYHYQNEYLKNRFSQTWDFPDYVELGTTSTKDGFLINDLSDKPLFSININEEKLKQSPFNIEIGLWLLAIVFCYLSVNSFAKYLWNKGEWIAALLSIVTVVIFFRTITMFWVVPSAIYKLAIFSPEHYASNFLFPSLGDLLINLMLLHWIVYFFYDRVRDLNFRIQNVRTTYIVSAFFILLSFATIDVLNFLFEGLVVNSNISFELTNILSLNWYSLAGLFILGLTLYTFFLITDILISIFHQFYLSKAEKRNVFLFTLLMVVISKSILNSLDILVITNTILLITLERAKSKKNNPITLPIVIFILTLFSFSSAYMLNRFNENKEKQNRELLASKLESANDPIAEYLLEGLVKRLKNDSFVKNYFLYKGYSNESLNNRIQQLYFGGYFSKYDLSLIEFYPNGNSVLTSNKNSLKYYDKLIEEKCTPTFNQNFYYLSNTFGILTYYGKIPVQLNDSLIGTIIIELKSKYFRDDNIFPELLLEGSLKMNKDFKSYSYSIYKQGRLISQQGEYPYSLSSIEFLDAKGVYSFLDQNEYNHLIYKPSVDLMIVVSKSNESPFKILAVFSYLFGIFSVAVFIFYIRRLLGKRFNLFTLNYKNWKGRFRFLFKTRIQLSMIFSILFSVGLIGYITFIYISDQNSKQQNDRLDQKVRSILISLEKKSNSIRAISNSSNDLFSIELKGLSDLYLTDINIYDLSGKLIISTQPKIFEEGLVSRYMNPNAFIEMHRLARSEFTTNEKIGSLNYLSSYAPIRNSNNRTIGYLNLPYFANKLEYENRVSQFLTTFINVYVFIFVLISFIAFFLANSITFPLTLIEEQLRETKIGKKMDPIHWKNRDEIGTLIGEYNRMIFELEANTEKLAKSERESAWREMAKQVAHEIKNPLTPMKLGLQLLQRSYDDKDPNFHEKFERFSKTFIQQIESLSLIASEFSNFAQMPVTKNEVLNIKDIISNVIDLYKNESDAIITLGFIPSLRANVMMDRDQMIRTFNNLIKNAIQSIPAQRVGKIDVELVNESNSILIIIQDNGVGISDEAKEKIFEPNFTTKSSGMGMGLAIIKNIISNAGGKIWFESSLNKGTTFFVSLALHEEE